MVELKAIALSYPLARGAPVEAVKGISARFERGSISVIIGPSGSGKTSLIRLMAGLLRPSAGELLIGGRPLKELPLQGREKTAVIFQDFGLLPWKTVRGNAELPLKIGGQNREERRRRIDGLLEEFGLLPFAALYPAQLSGGMKQRLAIVRALAGEPDLLLMDEPFSSLDALTREEAQDFLLATVQQRRLTVIMITHSIDEAVYLADRVFVMGGRNPGRLRAVLDLPVQARGRSAGGETPAALREMLGGDEAAVNPGPGQETPGTVAADDGDGTHRSAKPHGAFSAPRALSRPPAPSVLFALLAGLGLWALAAALLRKPFVPGPAETAAALARLAASGALARHVGASLFRIGMAMLTAFFPAAALGLAAGRIPRLGALVSPLIYLLHPLPKAAFLPIIMLVFGLGDASKVFLLGFIIFSQILVSARDAAGRLDHGALDSVRTMGASRWTLIRQVIIPAALPELFTSLRVSLGTAVAVLFLAETFATYNGLGYLIVDAWTRIAYPEMYAAIVCLSLLGLALFALTDLLERLCCPWK
ncbi:MAG: ATP-binding cassette domain-containing protein, partial [Treponema sp.]|nr:ATP-binding cassette domain-containing protein [Treponema sp.]